MKLYLCLLALLGIVNASWPSQSILGDDDSLKVPGENPLEYCATTKDYILSIDYLHLDPNPPVPGENLTVQAGGILAKTIDKNSGATVHVTVKYGFITLINKNYNLCDEAKIVDRKCPLAKGVFNVTTEVAIPKEVPPGTYTVTADVFTDPEAAEEKGCTITCMKGKIDFKF